MRIYLHGFVVGPGSSGIVLSCILSRSHVIPEAGIIGHYIQCLLIEADGSVIVFALVGLQSLIDNWLGFEIFALGQRIKIALVLTVETKSNIVFKNGIIIVFLELIGSTYVEGDLEGAIQKYNEAISKAPANQISAFKQALASAQLAEATPIMDQAVAKHGGGDPAGAIPLYEKGLSIYPNNPHGYTNLAGAYQAVDDFNKAKLNYGKAIDMDPKNESDNWYFIGLIDENFGQAAGAIADYSKYLAAKAGGSYAADAKARVARLRTNPASCQKLSTSAQVKASNQASGAFNDAVALQQANKYDEAIAKYNEAIAATPTEPSYYYSLGTCYQAKEDFDNALKNYEKAYSLNPKEPAYKQVITQLRAAKAAPLVNSAIEKQTKPDASGKVNLLGAIADYEAALKINDDATTHSYLGTAYQAQGNNQKAMQEYTRALAMDKTLVDTYYYLGTVYEALKMPPKAIEEYLKFTRSAPANNPNMAAVKERLKLLAPGRK